MRNWTLALVLFLGFATAAVAAPFPASITPATAIDGKILVATIEGNGFIAGSSDTRVTFEVGGILDARTGLSNISAEVVSASKIQVYLNVTRGAFIGSARALTVTNPDGTSGKLIGALDVTSNPGTTKFSTPLFSTATGFVEYNGSSSASMTIDPTNLYVSVKISSEAGMSQAKANPKILIDNIIFADNLGSKFTASSDATSGYLGYSGPYSSGTTGEVVITLYAESDTGVPETKPCYVNIPVPTPTPQPVGSYDNAVATPNTDPKPGNAMSFQFKTEGVVKEASISIFGSSAVYTRKLIPVKTFTAGDGSNFGEVSWDGSSDSGGLARTNVYIAIIKTKETVAGVDEEWNYKTKFVVYRE